MFTIIRNKRGRGGSGIHPFRCATEKSYEEFRCKPLRIDYKRTDIRRHWTDWWFEKKKNRWIPQNSKHYDGHWPVSHAVKSICYCLFRHVYEAKSEKVCPAVLIIGWRVRDGRCRWGRIHERLDPLITGERNVESWKATMCDYYAFAEWFGCQ